MNSIARRVGAIAIMGACGFYPQILLADSFTGEQFLEWDETAQDSYIQTSLTMASLMATRTHKPSGDCIDTWYFEPSIDRQAKNEEIRTTIAQNDTYHPSAVMLVFLEGLCGPFAPEVN